VPLIQRCHCVCLSSLGPADEHSLSTVIC
jgi:hypothetical protein